MPVIPFIPLIAAGIGSASSAYAAHKAGQTNDAVAAQQKPLLDAQTGLAKDTAERGKTLFNTGLPLFNSASGYYNSILRGTPKTLQQVLSPEIGKINETYRGAESGLERLAPGGVRDHAAADLSRQRVGQLASLVPTIRPMAAANLGNLATGALSAASGQSAQAGSIYSGLLGLGEQQRQFNVGESSSNGQAYGRLIADALAAWQRNPNARGAALPTAGAPRMPPANLGDFAQSPGQGAYA